GLLYESRSSAFLVEEASGDLFGIICLPELRSLHANAAASIAAESEPSHAPLATTAAGLAVREDVTIAATETPAEALRVLDRHGYRQLPVVETAGSKKV